MSYETQETWMFKSFQVQDFIRVMLFPSDQEICRTVVHSLVHPSASVISLSFQASPTSEARSLNGSDARGSAQVSTSLATSGDITKVFSVQFFVMPERSVESFDFFPWLGRLDRHP